MFSGIGPTELIIVLVIVLIIFGPKRLPGLGKQLGSGMREFKESISGSGRDEDDDDEPVRHARASAQTDGGAHAANAALGRPEADAAAADPDVVRERAPR